MRFYQGHNSQEINTITMFTLEYYNMKLSSIYYSISMKGL